MPDYNVISKGKYNHSRSGNGIPVVSYIFVREQGKKKLLLKFTNTRKSMLTGLNLDITTLDMYGREISVKNHKFGDISAKPGKDFVLPHTIEVEEECTDFNVKVKEALYGSYVYSESASGEKIDYLAPKEKFDVAGAVDEMRWESVCVKERIVKKRAVIGIFSFLLVIALSVFTFFQLKDFTGKQKTFLYNGVEYAFEGDDDGYGTDIYAVGYGGSRHADITVPEKIEDHTVKGIKANAFKDNARLKKLTVESEIAIEDGAFSGCKKLAEVNISKVTSLGEKAFADCEKLTSFYAENLESIGGYAFRNCTSLEKVEIKNDKKSLTLGEFVFYNCSALLTADIDQTIVYPSDYSLFRDCNNLVTLKLKNFRCGNDGADQTLISMFGTGENYGQSIKLESLTIGTLDYIGNGFCAYAPLRTVKVEELESAEIGDSAFLGCYSLKALDLPLSIEKVNDYGLYGTALKEFDDGELTYAGKYSFARSAVGELVSGKLTHIGEYAFSDCTGLDAFVFGDKTCEYIGEGAFSGCTSLVGIKYPQIQTSVPDLLFKGCTSLKEITFADSKAEKIGKSAFADCKRLAEINIPQAVAEIADDAFSGCSALSIISFAESGKLENIGERAFKGCSSLYTVKIPDTVNSVGFAAFSGCEKLKVITVPYVGGKYEENSYFGYIFGSQRYNNTSAYVPDSLETVNVTSAEALQLNAFYGCDRVINFNLPDSLKYIAPGAFAVCSSLKTIVIPDSVENIGQGAFRECDSIEEITLPFVGGGANAPFFGYIFGASAYNLSESFVPRSLETVNITNSSYLANYAFAFCVNLKKINLVPSEELTSIGVYAFYNCIRLEDVKLGEKLESIGDSAFFNCIELHKIVIPASLTDAGKDIFGNCFKLYEIWNLCNSDITAPNLLRLYTSLDEEMPKYFVDGYEIGFTDDNYYLLSYPKNVKELSLPTDYNYILTNHLFYWDGVIEKVTVPSCVTGFGNFVFYGCTNLTEAVLANQPEYTGIGGYAFASCPALKEVNIPYGVEIIYDYAFSECSVLSEISLPATVKTVGASAFANCSSMQSVNLSYGLENIGDSAFTGCTAIKNIEIPSTVGYIGAYAFYNCSSIVGLVIPSSVEVLDGFAFAECSSLENLEILNGLTEIGNYAFYRCSELADVRIAESVSVIGYYAFAECRSLKNLGLSEGLTEIGSYAFSYCVSLADITLPEGLVKISNNAFAETPVTSIIIPEGVRTIEGYAFGNCTKLRSVSLPSTLNRIDWGAFENCVKLYLVYNFSGLNLDYGSDGNGSVALRTLAIVNDYADAEYADAKNITYLRIKDHWLAVWCEEGTSAIVLEAFNHNGGTVSSFDVISDIFAGNGEITSVTVGSAVEQIGSYAFSGCYSLKSVTFDGAVNCTIDKAAFRNCSSLASVEFINGSPYSTGVYAFADCGRLTDLKLTYGLEEISDYSFQNSGVTAVVMPSSVTVLSNYAFADCGSLSSVGISNNIGEIGEYAFADSGLSSVEIPSSVTKIGSYAFENCDNLINVRFSDNLEEISSNAFRNCYSLKELYIPSSVVKLGNGAFESCYALENLEIAEGIEMIGDSAFNNTGIKSLTVPDSVTKIGEYAFAYCYNLKELKLSDNLEDIESGAFENCTALSSVTIPASVNYIRSYAFWGCTSLYVVYNLGDLDIRIKNSSNGYVAFNAVAVFTDPDDRAYFASAGNFEFVLLYGEWYLFKYNGNGGSAYLPKSFTYDGETVSSYTVRNYTFEGLNIGGLVIPKSVKAIQTSAFSGYSGGKVYFEGTDDEWQTLKTDYLDMWYTLYLKVDCVHELYKWTYASDGTVTTATDAYEYKEIDRLDSTCTENGYYTEQCTNCDHTRSFTLYAKGHTLVKDEGKSPTCTESGLSEGRHCEVCGTVTLEQTVIPAFGHTEVKDGAKAPTCTEDGLTEGSHCGVCGEILEEQEVIPATGHNHTETDRKEPTCTEEGYIISECTECGDVKTEILEMTEHDYDEDGVCTVCGRMRDEE